MAKNNKNLKIDVKKLKKVKNLKQRFLIFAVLMLAFASIFLFEAQLYSAINNKDFYGYENTISQDVNIHFVDVGQGDAMAIRLPDNKKVLIDAGPGGKSSNLVNYLENSFFLKDEEKTFDYFIISHTDKDHIGGGVDVFKAFQINALLRPNIYTEQEQIILNETYGPGYVSDKNTSKTLTFKNFVAQSQKEPGIYIEIFDYLTLPTITGADYQISFLSPMQRTYSDINSYSPIILFTYGQVKVLFTGDAETVVENQVIAAHGEQIKNIDVLKVGHHGSNTSTTQNFVDMVKPRYSVIQVGKNNIYNHPTNQIIQRLENAGSSILRNDMHGNIVVGFSKTKSIFTFVTTNTFLPIAVEVWQIYLSGGIVLFYFVMFFDFKKLKIG